MAFSFRRTLVSFSNTMIRLTGNALATLWLRPKAALGDGRFGGFQCDNRSAQSLSMLLQLGYNSCDVHQAPPSVFSRAHRCPASSDRRDRCFPIGSVEIATGRQIKGKRSDR